MIIDCISDTHGFVPELTSGDLLIIAGDLTRMDEEEDHWEFIRWMEEQDYRKVVYIAGNHDNFYRTSRARLPCYNSSKVVYLQDSACDFEGMKIWGSPWTAWFKGIHPSCKAFTLSSDEKLAKKWALIPMDTDILITHSPAGVLDVAHGDVRCGSSSLNSIVMAIKPRLHAFGHIHECGGQRLEKHGTISVNASYVDETYDPVHEPVRVIL